VSEPHKPGQDSPDEEPTKVGGTPAPPPTDADSVNPEPGHHPPAAPPPEPGEPSFIEPNGKKTSGKKDKNGKKSGEPDDPDQQSVGQAVLTGVKDAGAPVARFLDMVGGHLILVGRALVWLPRRPFRGKNYIEAAEYIGWGSLPIVLIVGAFTGMVLSLQAVYAFRQLGFESYSGAMTGKALSIELAPVLTSLMLSGRAGAGIATELGTMRISEQIDALESMAVNPVQFLVLPRLMAAMIVTPILTLLFFMVGMGGAYLVAVVLEGVSQGQWVAKIRDLVEFSDVIQGLIKSVFFGFLVTLIGCYQGFNASGGGRGVGIGTTRAVVMGSVSTLVLDYFLTDILLSVFNTKGS
jgi:phospholipid/cholesterol/gamma-HCH transport system permease protein